MLIWLANAPKFQVESDAEVVSFIDEVISCQKPENNPNLLNLVNRQVHSHSHTCRKNGREQCRFNYPQPPMQETRILYPLESDMDEDKVKGLKQTWKSINKCLDDAKEGIDVSFDQLLLDLNVTKEDYILAIRSSIKTSTIFLKRSPNELRVHNYNSACLSAWRASMDIQFVLDAYACCVHSKLHIKTTKGYEGTFTTSLQ